MKKLLILLLLTATPAFAILTAKEALRETKVAISERPNEIISNLSDHIDQEISEGTCTYDSGEMDYALSDGPAIRTVKKRLESLGYIVTIADNLAIHISWCEAK